MTGQTQSSSNQEESNPVGLERLFTIDQIAQMGGPRRAKLYSDIKQGRLKTMKFGRSTRISESAWKNYLNLAASP
jgi:excisionase family DNA binding protein